MDICGNWQTQNVDSIPLDPRDADEYGRAKQKSLECTVPTKTINYRDTNQQYHYRFERSRSVLGTHPFDTAIWTLQESEEFYGIIDYVDFISC